eukprot:6123810-Pleurochrysis_carterae.AAC.1
MEAQGRSHMQSNSRSCGWPISPARRSRLCASSAAAHSSRRSAVSRHPPPLASPRNWAARNARLSFRAPTGGSSMRMRLYANTQPLHDMLRIALHENTM